MEAHEQREPSESLLPREQSNQRVTNGENARVEHSASNRQEGIGLEPVPIQVRSRDNRPEISESLLQPHDHHEHNDNSVGRPVNGETNNGHQQIDATMMESRLSENLNRAPTAANQEPAIRNQPTNIGNLEIGQTDLRPADSSDLFVIQDHANRLQDNYGDSLQLTRFESNIAGQSPITQVQDSSPEREDSPHQARLQGPHDDMTDRRQRGLGTIHSVRSDEDKEKSLHAGEKGRDDH